MKKYFFSALLPLLSSCSSFHATSDKPVGTERARLFPDGTYRHDVSLTLPGRKTQSFRGVVRLAPQELEVVGLAFFNATAFRIKDDFTKEAPDVQIFVEPLKKHEDKLRRFYALLKKLLLLPARPTGGDGLQVTSRPDGFPLSLETTELGESARLQFGAYDERLIPRHLTVEGDKFFVEIQVAGYEL